MIKKRPNDNFYALADYEPFDIQRAIHNSTADIRVACVGRQVGKSHAAAIETSFELIANPGSVGWVVAPTSDQAEIIFSRVLSMVEKIIEKYPFCKLEFSLRKLRLRVKHYQRADSSGTFRGLTPYAISEFRGKSADRLNNLKGSTLNYVILDEAALMLEDVWTEAIQPMLSTTKGWALFISTPKGWNWFYKAFKKGWRGKKNPIKTTPPASIEEELDSNYSSFHAASWEVRKDVGDEWYEAVRQRSSSEITFRQEYGAEFISNSGSVFNNLNLIIRLPCKEVIKTHIGNLTLVEGPRDEKEYIIGADFGKHQDFTVFAVVDVHQSKTVALYRSNEIDWLKQIRKLKYLSEWYNDAVVVADTWGVGDVLLENMEEEGIQVIPAPFKNDRIKEEYINHFCLLIDNSSVAVPDKEVIFEELRRFQYHTTKAGKHTMRAYGRSHDDIVVALTLAYSMCDGEGIITFNPDDLNREDDADNGAGVLSLDYFESFEERLLIDELKLANTYFA